MKILSAVVAIVCGLVAVFAPEQADPTKVLGLLASTACALSK